jgi:hypothetical protein
MSERSIMICRDDEYRIRSDGAENSTDNCRNAGSWRTIDNGIDVRKRPGSPVCAFHKFRFANLRCLQQPKSKANAPFAMQ